ncbi:DUF551 domain-containing protein [Klebsiella sp. CN_Kp098]|uniref:DUF551 domain-containing protein n=1 Tax=unclassified Klebsiella TaxID=2608929 RepID=UPI0032B31750
MTNNQLTDEQIITLQLRIMSALSFYQQRPEREAKRMAELLMLAGTAASELQERRKADSELVAVREPIAWLNDAYLARGVVDGEAGSEDAGPGYIPVYREAQSAPVAPEEMPCGGAADDYHDGYQDGWNACRSAMLQAEPVTTANKLGNSPVIPGAWIPVSERMPENDVSVLTFDGMYKRVHHAMYGHWQCWEPDKITHWMPMPAAPQEVKGE